MKAVLVGRRFGSLLSRMRTLAVLGLAVLLAASLVLAQNFAPPPSKPPKKEVLQAIDAKTEKLSKTLSSLRRQKVSDPWLADVEIYLKAAQWIRDENEFYQKESADWTLEAL